MKKRILLGLIPALLVLSSCHAVPKAEPKAEPNPLADENLFIEDVEIREDDFSEAKSEWKDLLVRKTLQPHTPYSDDVPAIGIQYKDGTKTVNINETPTEINTISMRFVAAIKVLDAGEPGYDDDLATTSAVWTRTMYDGNGDVVKASAQKTSTKAYTALSEKRDALDGSGYTSTIEEFNQARVPNGSYTHFVVYAMMDIPADDRYSGYDMRDYYLNAYITVNGSSYSQLVAAPVNSSGDFYNFSHDKTGFFIIGDLGGDFGEIQQDAEFRGRNPGDNYASFTLPRLTSGQMFVIIENDSKFRAFDSSCLKGTDNTIGDYFENDDGLISVKAAAEGKDFILFLNHSGELWQFYWDNKGLYVKGDAVGDWGSTSYQLTNSPNNYAQIINVSLGVGQFKIANAGWSDEWGYYGNKRNNVNYWPTPSISFGEGIDSSYFGAGDGEEGTTINISCKKAGNYNIYINDYYQLYIEFYSAA